MTKIDGVTFPESVVAEGQNGFVLVKCDSIDDAMKCWDLYADRYHPAGYGTSFVLKFESMKCHLTMRRHSHCD